MENIEKRIDQMIATLKLGDKYYDNEKTHGEYDQILEDFITHFDANLLQKMHTLIGLEKIFWFA